MFTGLIEAIGSVKSIMPIENYLRLTIVPEPMFENLVNGESIAVSGTCLTVTTHSSNSFTAEASQETVKLTTIGNLKTGDRVNLERAMKADGRLGGHIVAGHIDGKLKITQIKQIGKSRQITMELPDAFAAYVIDKGSVAINGVSLTVMNVSENRFTVNIIPESQIRTTLMDLTIGDDANVEFDLIGKYILRAAQFKNTTTALTVESMRKMGY